jgi:predicted NBD/HSP70 family sugar kinase
MPEGAVATSSTCSIQKVIVIGGGAAALYRPLFDKLHERISHLTVNPRADEVPIFSARYGADSGIAGGAALCV